jgi:3-oxoacyl-[acyl-carrier-protein] synthase I
MPSLVLAAPSEIILGGRTVFMKALATARRVLESGLVDEVVLGAADSLVDPATLSSQARQGKLLGESNIDGILPGEAATCLSLSMPNLRRQRTLGGQILAAHECPIELAASQPLEVSMGNALTALFRRVHADGPPGTVVNVVSSCQNGETRWDRYFAYAYLRNASFFAEPLAIRSVAQSYGDVGCAALALEAALAVIPSFRAPRPGAGRKSLLYALCDTAVAGSLVVEADA